MIMAVASIFKRMSDSPEVKLSSTLDFTAAYKVRCRLMTVDMILSLTFTCLEIHHLSETTHACRPPGEDLGHRWTICSRRSLLLLPLQPLIFQ